jgi:hypothetical protein
VLYSQHARVIKNPLRYFHRSEESNEQKKAMNERVKCVHFVRKLLFKNNDLLASTSHMFLRKCRKKCV